MELIRRWCKFKSFFLVTLGILLLLVACALDPYGFSYQEALGEFAFILRWAFTMVGFLLIVAGFAIYELIVGIISFLMVVV